METGQVMTFNNHEIVRAEYFAHTNEPMLIFNPARDFVYVNAVCLKRLPNMNYVQFLIFPSEKSLSLRPCTAEEREAVRLRSAGKYPNRARHIRCEEFTRKIIALMQWDKDYRYKLLGNVVTRHDETVIAFNLTAHEIVKPIDNDSNRKPAAAEYPQGWDGAFGINFGDYKSNPLVKTYNQDTEILLDTEVGNIS